MTIFESYTGNAMLNNALMTIEALDKLSNVSEITPQSLLSLYERMNLPALNQRMKNYTMLFTKNGPLHNDKIKGVKIYDALLRTIINHYECDGDKTCEISGLKFSTTFEILFKNALKKVGLSDKDINKKDLTISRMWFPLLGGLGSDAHALPQAKFAIQIHPICVFILQFLPFSSLLYKGGILLVDSSNFELAREMVARHVNIIIEKTAFEQGNKPIENIKDFAKGHYLLTALDILIRKEEMEEAYSDLNLWSFSNSGTGASCEIDRIPNLLITKLKVFYQDVRIVDELKSILRRNDRASSFLESLEDNTDWYLLYPNVLLNGKKKEPYEGVSISFLETYYQLTQNPKSFQLAKYVAGLINKYKSKAFEKLLTKTSAWNEPEYRLELYKVLIVATENGEWDLKYHVQLLDNPNQLPVKNYFYYYHRLVHFYYWNKEYLNELPQASLPFSKVYEVCKWFIGIIQHYSRRDKMIERLCNPNEYSEVSYHQSIFEALESNDLLLENVLEALFDESFNYSKIGTSELLRIFFLQKVQPEYEIINWATSWSNDELAQQWIRYMASFVEDYKNYFSDKNQNRETMSFPIHKFFKTVHFIANHQDNFYNLVNEMIDNVNVYLSKLESLDKEKWSMNDLICNPLGNKSLTLTRLCFIFLLIKTAKKLQKN